MAGVVTDSTDTVDKVDERESDAPLIMAAEAGVSFCRARI